MRYKELLEEYYETESTLTHNGQSYDLNKIFQMADSLPVRDFTVEDLKWVLEYDIPRPNRVEAADLSVPIIVTRSRGKLLVIDGLHRLAKAIRYGLKTIRGKLIPEMDLERAIITEEVRYDSKPAYYIPVEYGETDDEFPVWMNPSRNTVIKMIEANGGQTRGIATLDGTFYIWNASDLVHGDVYNYLKLEDYTPLLIGKSSIDGHNYVIVPDGNDDPQPLNNPIWEPVLTKIFKRYFPNGVKLEMFYW